MKEVLQALPIVDVVLSTILAIAFFWIKSKADKIDSLEKKLNERADQIVNERFASIEYHIQEPFKRFDEIIKRIEKRLERGEETFGAQAETAHSLDKKIVEAKAEIKTWAMENFATARDLADLRNIVQDLRVIIGNRGK